MFPADCQMTHLFIYNQLLFSFTVQVHFFWPQSPERSPGGLVKLAAQLAAHSTIAAVKLLLKHV